MKTPDLIDEAPVKYNVGDRVYAIGKLDFLGNPYHFETAINAFDTVAIADKHRFSTSPNRDLTDVCGMDMWQVNHQSDGSPLYSDRVLLHVEKDREAILSAVDKFADAFMAEAEEKKKAKIAANLAKIEDLKADIADIEQNGVTFGFNSIRMVSFLTENKNALLEKLKP